MVQTFIYMNRLLKVCALILSLAATGNNSLKAQSVAINTDGSVASSSAMLDVKSISKGLLVPRMSSNQRSRITAPAPGLLVYDTDTKSFWYYNGASWSGFAAGPPSWLLAGNSGNTSNNFIGTLDKQPLRFRVNNNLAGAIDTSNNIFLGIGSGLVNTSGNGNTAAGHGAMYANISGIYNTAAGYQSLYRNTSGYYNVAVGTRALNSNTNADYNVAVGSYALSSQSYNGGGTNWISGNVAIGANALLSNNPTAATNGINNTATGYAALENNSTGHENTATGNIALFSNNTGKSNTASGYAALFSNQDGNNNTATGQATLYSNIDGSSNTATGFAALTSNTKGDYNTATGANSLLNNTRGVHNTAIGYSALYFNTTATGNIALGSFALQNQAYSNTGVPYPAGNTAIGFNALNLNNPTSSAAGVFNTAVGYNAMLANVSGSFNTSAGYAAGPAAGTFSNTSCIGNGATATGSNQFVLGNNAVTQLYCYGAYAATTANAPNLTVLSTGQIVRSTSSRRYKKDIVPLDINTAAIYKLMPVSYGSYTDDDRHFGLIAEDVAEIIPELASYAKEKDVVKGSSSEKLIPDAVQYSLLSVLLLKELQQHEQTIKEMQVTIKKMQQQLDDQQARAKKSRK